MSTRLHSARPDLLAYLETMRHGARRDCRRVERWRRRGLQTDVIAALAEVVACRLARVGVREGDRIGLLVGDGPLWVAGFFGILRLGGVVVPVEPSMRPPALREITAGLDLRAWLTEPEAGAPELPVPVARLDWSDAHPLATASGIAGHRAGSEPSDALPDWPAPDPERPAQIVLTSGTSAVPKSVTVSHRNLRAVLDPLAEETHRYRWLLRALPTLRLAVTLPLSHLYGQVVGVFLPVLLRANVSFVPGAQGRELAELVRSEHAWALVSVPRTFDLLARHLRTASEVEAGGEDLEVHLQRIAALPRYRRALRSARIRRRCGHRLLILVCGGAALDAELERFWGGLGYVVIQGYGLTEAAPLVTFNHPFRTRPGALGQPLDGVDIRIATDGEILVRGDNVTRPRGGDAVTAGEGGGGESRVDAEGWLHTGDLGRVGDDGELYYVGRKGERIVTPAGLNIDPGPIAEALRVQPGIVDALVLERPWGGPGIVAAVVLARPGAEIDAAVRAVNRELSDAARIRTWRSWPEVDLPRTRTGKLRRAAIRSWLEQQAPAASDARAEAVPADAHDALIGLIRDLTGDGATVDAGGLGRDTSLADTLSSLDRVELSAALESTYGVSLSETAFLGGHTLGQLADDLTAAITVGATPDIDATAPVSPSVVAPATSVDPAAWRRSPPARAARFVLREILIRSSFSALVELRVAGLEHVLGLEPPFILTANHVSLVDPTPILFAVPYRLRHRIAPAVRWEHFTERRSGRAQYVAGVLGLNLIPLVQVGDWRPTLEIAGRLVDRGWCPLVYPEGKRSLDGSLWPFQLGVAVLAQHLHLPIVPCATGGLLSVLPRGAGWPRGTWQQRAPIAVHFGTPIPAPGPHDDLQALIAGLERETDSLRRHAVAHAGRH